MRYFENPPSTGLAAYVRCVWTFDSEGGGGAPERIVPDGRAELIVHRLAPYEEGGVAQPRAIFAGQLTRPLWLRASGPASVIGVRFHPAGARRFIGRPLAEFNDLRVAVDALWPGDGAALVAAVAGARGEDACVAAMESFVAAHVELHPPTDELIARCAGAIERAAGKVSIEELCATAGLGRRQLERRFRDVVGVGPSLLASIMRFRNVFDLIEHGGARPWTEASIAAGYYDQSHFIRDFRRFVGCTPTEFVAAREGLASALVTDR